MRIAIAQISSESNHFVTRPCELDFFRSTGFVHQGAEIFQLRGGGEIGGMLSVLESEPGIELVPLLAARANSAGPLSENCYGYLRERLLGSLKRSQPVDGLLLSHHGSMSAIGEYDTEGDIACAARRLLGPDAPIVMTLDLHANVTRRMVESSTAILGYEQYPHRDVYDTGMRAARLLLGTLRHDSNPAMAYAKLPLLLTGFHGTTDNDAPFGRLMQKAKALEKTAGILSASLFFVGSYIDVPEMGSGALIVSDGDPDRSATECVRLVSEFWKARHVFDVKTFSVNEAVDLGRQIEGGPVLLLDTADTTGGGAAGDGSAMIRELVTAAVHEPSIAMIVDPESVEQCVAVGVGREVVLQLGHKLDPQWGQPFTITATVKRIFEGRFRYTGGILGGTSATMGLSAVVEAGRLSILVASVATYDWADEQYRCASLDTRGAKFVGVKNMMNFREGYADCMKGFFPLDVSGPTPPDMRMLSFKRVNRPIYPLDDIQGEPAVQLSFTARRSGD
jgi:microcystin degradation protein MlrC